MTSDPTLFAPAGVVIASTHIPKFCDNGCGKEVSGLNRFHSMTFTKGARVNHKVSASFCSTECRAAWWVTGGTDDYAAVHNPDTGPTVAVCQHIDPDEQKACERCWGAGVIVTTPGLWCSHDPTHQNQGHTWDTDLRMTIIEHDAPTHGKVRISHGDQIIAPISMIQEMWLHACPHVLNDWWKTPISPGEHDQVRAQFAALKAKSQ